MQFENYCSFIRWWTHLRLHVGVEIVTDYLSILICCLIIAPKVSADQHV